MGVHSFMPQFSIHASNQTQYTHGGTLAHAPSEGLFELGCARPVVCVVAQNDP